MVVMRCNGSDQNVLVHFSADDSIENALWAPDGQSIAFYPWDGLWIVDASTGVRTATIPFEGAGSSAIVRRRWRRDLENGLGPGKHRRPCMSSSPR
jgi:hypothetical protein